MGTLINLSSSVIAPELSKDKRGLQILIYFKDHTSSSYLSNMYSSSKHSVVPTPCKIVTLAMLLHIFFS